MDNYSADENSNDGLEIIVESPRPKKRAKKELDETDRKIIQTVEKDFEENLEEKAAKANLSTKHVKNIIKQVVTNEHVLALVRHAEDPDNCDELITLYEPKYTRAKTKQLLSSTNTQTNILPWTTSPKSPSDVHMLFSEELQEDSSGDEYIPKRPQKSSLSENHADVSQNKSKEKEANIALRTRSKLCLSHTPLEAIEEAFIPPDITTDMYDMDCDDDVWKDFLKTFTRPLDEVTKGPEDDDHDPEYNVLADEEIDEVDQEELRADRAVTVSRKEFNCLMAELFEFADIYESNKINATLATDEDNSAAESSQSINKNNESDSENNSNTSIHKYQIAILAQQLRQHVQMLTQNFLLTYEHPEFANMATEFKELLISMHLESTGKECSIYHILNLAPAIKVITDWEELFANKSKEVIECKQYVEKVIFESIQAKMSGTEYIVTFPTLVMKTISNSEVFMYPNFLPRIPFKSFNVTRCPLYFFTQGEDNLIALFLEKAIPFMKEDPFHLTKHKKLNMQHVWQYLQNLLMQHVATHKIKRHVLKQRQPSSADNPIRYFYHNKKATPVVHYVIPVDSANLLPPCKRSPGALPHLWREYLYPQKSEEPKRRNGNFNNQTIIVSTPLQLWSSAKLPHSSVYNVQISNKVVAKKKIVPKGSLPPPPKFVHRKKRTFLKGRIAKAQCENNNNPQVANEQTINMLPDMPSLGDTPIKKRPLSFQAEATTSKNSDNASVRKEQELSFQNIASFFQHYKPESCDAVRSKCQSDAVPNTSSNETVEKDNPDDIHELMVASCTVKNLTKKEPSGAEKKRAKLRREFLANLAMATPDAPEVENQKEEDFADAFYEKLRQTLTTDDYNRLTDILASYDESKGQFVDLYKNILSVLLPKYKELSDEFLLFLTDIQAHKVGQLMPYFIMKEMGRFMKKLQMYFKDQPSHLKKIIKALTDLAENPDVTMGIVKSTILPLLKGNAALTDWFLRLFPCERPPSILSSGPSEIIDMSKEVARPPDEDICETVILPDTEDPYGGPTCICTCHNVDSLQFKSRWQHCTKCGLKFIQGKIYIQTGKALRPAVISFLTNPEKDHTKRLSAAQRKRSETSPNKQVTSPNKENQAHEEIRNNHESDEQCDINKKRNQRLPKIQRKGKIKHSDKPKENGKSHKETASKNKLENVSCSVKGVKASSKRQSRKRTNSGGRKSSGHKLASQCGQQKRPAEEPVESSGSAELVELKVSSGNSGESERDCFQSSQCTTNEDKEASSNTSNLNQVQTSDGAKIALWTREEDKIILHTFRQMSDNEETFKHLSEVLHNRSVNDIKNRFHKLMTLLQQMTAKST